MEQAGYARVSTREERQVFDRQIDALRVAGCHRIFNDRSSRASADRHLFPGLTTGRSGRGNVDLTPLRL